MTAPANISRQKPIGILIGIVLVACGVVGAIYYNRSSSDELGNSAKSFYTVDDGKTWFVDDANRIPPFDHEGKTAYRCYLVTTDGRKTKFVSHLERYTPTGKKFAEEQAKKGNVGSLLARRLSASSIEVKRPLTGDTGWVSQNDAAGTAIMRGEKPDGTMPANLEPVWP